MERFHSYHQQPYWITEQKRVFAYSLFWTPIGRRGVMWKRSIHIFFPKDHWVLAWRSNPTFRIRELSPDCGNQTLHRQRFDTFRWPLSSPSTRRTFVYLHYFPLHRHFWSCHSVDYNKIRCKLFPKAFSPKAAFFSRVTQSLLTWPAKKRAFKIGRTYGFFLKVVL